MNTFTPERLLLDEKTDYLFLNFLYDYFNKKLQIVNKTHTSNLIDFQDKMVHLFSSKKRLSIAKVLITPELCCSKKISFHK